MISSADNGYSYLDQPSDGGYSSIGTGAASALPAGSWRLPSNPFGNSPASGAGWESRLTPPNGVHSLPGIPTSRIPKVPRPGTGEPDPAPNTPNTSDTTDSQKLMDLFRSMFGTATKSADPAQQGSVVVYGDPTQTGSSMGAGGKLAIIGVLALAAWWAWKKWGGKA